VIITIIFIVAGIILLIATLIYVKRKNNLQEINRIDNRQIKKVKKTLCNLWGIDGINDQVVSTNKKQHSLIIEIESIEYNLLHDDEKNTIDRELISIAQMIKFPIQFLEIKQQIDMYDSIEEIKINTINANQYIKETARHLIRHLERIQDNKNLFERKNYMIISSFNSLKIAELELKDFYQLLRYHLNNIKVSTRALTDMEIMELIYEQQHKGSNNKIAEMIEKGGLDLYVTSKKGKKIKNV